MSSLSKGGWQLPVDMLTEQVLQQSEIDGEIVAQLDHLIADLGIRVVSLRGGRARLRFVDGRDASLAESKTVLNKVADRIKSHSELRTLRRRVRALAIL